MWEEDEKFRGYFQALADHFQVVRFDARGNGLSDQHVAEFTLEGLTADLEAVMDQLNLTEVVLFGQMFGGPIAVSYISRHPDRVSKLILDGTYARGEEIAEPEQQQALLDSLSKMGPAAFFMLSAITDPEPDERLSQRAMRASRSISKEAAVALFSLGYDMDVASLLPNIKAPTLVLHRRESRVLSFDLGRRLASSIPGARFVSLDGANHNPWEGNAAEHLTALGGFLAVDFDLRRVQASAKRPLPFAILFTDMESSTTLTRQLGDAAAQEVRRAHNDIVRTALAGNDGSEIKHTGDGIMASFATTSSALECAIAIQRGVAAHQEEHPDSPLGVYVGLNAGEPIAEDDDLFGTSVDLAARLVDHAEPGQIIASDVVRQLAAGKDFLFADLGETELRGFEDPVKLWELRWQDD